MDNNKILGVIGGMGPLASKVFYEMVIENTKASSDQDHLDLFMYSHASLPDRTKCIEDGTVDEFKKLIIEDCNKLISIGASCIAITCNTAHVVADEVQNNINVPIINMIGETAKYISKIAPNKKVAILGTDGTIAINLYQKELKKMGIEPYVPSDKTQKLVMKIVYDYIKAGKEVDYTDFQKIEDELIKEKCSRAILACTELSVFKESNNLSDYYVDAMMILAKKSIIECGKQVKNSNDECI